MKYEANFFLGRQSGDVTLRRKVGENKKYVLYALARDNGIPNEEISKWDELRAMSWRGRNME